MPTSLWWFPLVAYTFSLHLGCTWRICTYGFGVFSMVGVWRSKDKLWEPAPSFQQYWTRIQSGLAVSAFTLRDILQSQHFLIYTCWKDLSYYFFKCFQSNSFLSSLWDSQYMYIRSFAIFLYVLELCSVFFFFVILFSLLLFLFSFFFSEGKWVDSIQNIIISISTTDLGIVWN